MSKPSSQAAGTAEPWPKESPNRREAPPLPAALRLAVERYWARLWRAWRVAEAPPPRGGNRRAWRTRLAETAEIAEAGFEDMHAMFVSAARTAQGAGVLWGTRSVAESLAPELFGLIDLCADEVRTAALYLAATGADAPADAAPLIVPLYLRARRLYEYRIDAEEDLRGTIWTRSVALAKRRSADREPAAVQAALEAAPWNMPDRDGSYLARMYARGRDGGWLDATLAPTVPLPSRWPPESERADPKADPRDPLAGAQRTWPDPIRMFLVDGAIWRAREREAAAPATRPAAGGLT